MFGAAKLIFTNPWVLLALVGLVVGAYFSVLAYGEGRYQDGRTAYANELALAQDEANEKLRNQRKVKKHENKNLDRAALIAEHCRRGWVRNPEHCPK